MKNEKIINKNKQFLN